MRVLISAGWLGGAGGAERALHSVLRALEDDDVDVVARQHLGGPLATIGSRARIHPPLGWRWRAAARESCLKGTLIQRILNPVRARVLPRYDVYLQFFAGPNLNPTIRAGVRLLVPSGNEVPPEVAERYDYIALQSPDNARFVPDGVPTVLLPPPVYDLAEVAEKPEVDLPDQFYLTAFNPYGEVKGTEDLARIADEAPHPIIWCHSQATVSFSIPEDVATHSNIVHVEDPTAAQMRWLYENCVGYVSLSRTEGFGWSIADALRYSPAVFSRRIGVLTFDEARSTVPCQFSEDLRFDWSLAHTLDIDTPPSRDLRWLSGPGFRVRLLDLVGRAEQVRQ